MCRTLLTPTVSRKRSSPTSVVAIVSRRRSMPAPVRTDTSSDGPNADDAARHAIRRRHRRSHRTLHTSIDARSSMLHAAGRSTLLMTISASRARGVDVGAILLAQRTRSIDHHEHEIRRLRRGARALNAFTLDDLLGLADARGVDERDRDAADVAALGQQVARRAGDLRDDRAIGADECVEEARLSNVGAADDRDLAAFTNHAALTRAGEQRADLRVHDGERGAHFVGHDEVIALVREIERRFQLDDEIEQRLADLRHRARERAVELIEGLPRLRRRHRVDQIGDRFRLHEIDASVKKRAQRELTRRRQPRACAQRGGDDAFEQNRTAVRGDLDDVFAGVGMRRAERTSRPPDRSPARSARLASLRRSATSVRSRTCVQRRVGARCSGFAAGQQPRGDRLRVRAADANHAEAGAAGRRGDRDDGVVGGEHAPSSSARRRARLLLRRADRDDDALHRAVALALGRRVRRASRLPCGRRGARRS